ncbi:GNAT family N-acetyltransferase [Alkalihalobacillus sp. MEB130]|uniref:GNAT family N-acetyltransferase n=1 Tax=Alkalihalobacillus sp. MEB130 TaxID=2976704 RepID=UPI0028E039CB|nr:GNAT family N-acetyltransferase [Alkalihalobacillus sp. MEB130]MDT8861898.1 GNAT family N-acetyltransferase [Alkalihalobacillus sp. MEB130]
MSKVNVRPYKMTDFESLLDVQKEAFPPPFPEDLWWNREQIEAHVTTFPEGALLAEIDGVVVGSATSLLIAFDGKPHTWEEVADDGYIRKSHNPNGDSLYGIDLCVRPSYRGKGIAGALYEARKDTVRQLGLKRFIAGCRIPNYHEHADRLDAESYVKAVEKGEIKDLVLTFMLKQGLHPLQVMPNYLEDDESLDYAVLVEWRNDQL